MNGVDHFRARRVFADYIAGRSPYAIIGSGNVYRQTDGCNAPKRKGKRS